MGAGLTHPAPHDVIAGRDYPWEVLPLLLLFGCPGSEDDTASPGEHRSLPVTEGASALLYGGAQTGAMLQVADLDGDGGEVLLVWDQRADGPGGGAPAIGVVRGPLAGQVDLLLTATWLGYAGEGATMFGYPSAVADLDDDGVPELLAADWATSCLGDGAAWILRAPFEVDTFATDCAAPPEGWSVLPGPTAGYGHAIAGRAGELVVAAPASDQLYRYAAPFDTAVVEPGPASVGTSLLVVDLDGDGTEDVLAGAPDAGELVILDEGSRTGPVGAWTALAAGDVDGDGAMDLAVGVVPTGSAPSGSIWLVAGDAPGLDAGQRLTDSHWVYERGPVLDLADFDDDGRLDLACGADSEADAAVVWFGPFPSERSLTLTAPQGDPGTGLGRAFAHGAFTGEGLDLLVAAPLGLDDGVGRPGVALTRAW